MTKHNVQTVLQAVERGITKTAAAKLLDVSWTTMSHYCTRWPEVERAFRERRIEMVDLAEAGLRGALLRQEAWAIAFTLRTLGRELGYSDQREIKHLGDGENPVEVRLTIVRESGNRKIDSAS